MADSLRDQILDLYNTRFDAGKAADGDGGFKLANTLVSESDAVWQAIALLAHQIAPGEDPIVIASRLPLGAATERVDPADTVG